MCFRVFLGIGVLDAAISLLYWLFDYSTQMTILLPLLLFCTWLAIVVAPLFEYAVEDARAGVPEDSRRGVSIFPGNPFMPLLFWGLAYGIDLFFSPWGTITIGGMHAIALAWAIFVIVRDIIVVRRIEAGKDKA